MVDTGSGECRTPTALNCRSRPSSTWSRAPTPPGSALATGRFLAAALANATRTALARAATAFIATAIGLVQQYMEDYAGGANSLRERLDTALKGALSVTEAEGEWRLMTARNDFSALEPLIRNLNGTIAANRQIELALE